ncbi:uncharacterized protein LOC114521544 [Dendronephthya gigantea]|uniref:uncharacterized protein LOC114521544 n=1 Tax=Dendronephthya gigantea TaxID=151771 RepID=UPI00106C8CEC|nr:uncharacterized protein LOC114521544 [Dendronephthya gigantea]
MSLGIRTCHAMNLGFFILTFCSFTVICDGVSLSPKDWPKEDFDRLKSYSAQRYFFPKPLAVSPGYGVVSGTTNSLAVHAGIVALQQGGNAMDACVATALTEITLAAGCYVSFAGVTEILYYNSHENRVYSLDGGWNIPTDLDVEQILPIHTTKPNGASVLVPGFFAGIDAAVKRLANFDLKTLLEPALYFAKNGFNLSHLLAGNIAANYNDVTLLRTEDGKRLFTNPETGEYYKYGELFKQPELLDVLQSIAENGVNEMYTGAWAQDMVSLVQKENGVITMSDMSSYTVNWKDPINTTYSDYVVSTSGTNNAGSGGIELLEKLNLMEFADLRSYSYLTNSTRLYWFASIIRFSNFISLYLRTMPNAIAILEREFQLDFSIRNRTSKEFAYSVWSQMSKPGGMDEINEKIKKLLGKIKTSLCMSKGGCGHSRKVVIQYTSFDTSFAPHSDGVVAMDKYGNMCSMIHTINSQPWGTGLFVHGIALPHSAAINKYYIKQLSLVTPQIITSVLDENLNPNQALSRPQLMLPSLGNYLQDIRVQRCTIDQNVLHEVRRKGQQITEIDDHTSLAIHGLGVLISVDKDGLRYASSTPFLDGLAESTSET